MPKSTKVAYELNVVSGKVKKPMGKGVIKIKCIAHMDESG
jgi:hypothetical protein